ncbi:hypothetical protein UPYG_G00047560 [Umbra pygmaea]|uniref:Uncharacterized protein n=1 Tax=Umbra pygmaea TaxID=75934 RepID=A0ABD0XRB4_UMBPY
MNIPTLPIGDSVIATFGSKLLWRLNALFYTMPNNKVIWIMGSSYIHRGEERARETMGANLGLAAKVHWNSSGSPADSLRRERLGMQEEHRSRRSDEAGSATSPSAFP